MKVLFVTFYFPPMPDVAALRTVELCRGLLHAGHDVSVVTYIGKHAAASQADEFERLAAEIPGGRFRVKRVRSWWRSLHEGPSVRSAKGWRGKSWAVVNRLASRLLTFVGIDSYVPWAVAAWASVGRAVEYDCVLVSAGPFSTLFTGYALARTRGKPLIFDYRDVWNGTPYIRWRCSTRWLERILLARASLVVSISPSCLSSIIDTSSVSGAVITNGIGEEVQRLAKEPVDRTSLSLVYAGAFYPPKRSFEPIAAALAVLARRGQTPPSCSYFGPSGAYVHEVASRHHVEHLLEIPGFVPRRDALIAQKESLCVVVVTSVEPSCGLADKGIVTGKIFEAIALAPSVLVISPLESDIRTLTAHLPHVKHFHGGEVIAIADWLAQIKAQAPTRAASSAWAEFGWDRLANQFVACLEKAVSSDFGHRTRLLK